ncbi:hypothetical protein HC256_005953 [Beauveria bassiana]|nr:hypothetical protein HC256_005953 [Beauveria bassiana]
MEDGQCPSPLVSCHVNFDDLVDTLVLGHLEVVLFRNHRRHESGQIVLVAVSTLCIKELPNPDFGGPCSISHDEGASTDVTGLSDFWSACITAGNGSRTSPEKLNPITQLDTMFRRRLHDSTNRRLRQ